MSNMRRSPAEWREDIARSIAEYNAWYLANAPGMYVAAAERARVEFAEAMRATGDLRRLDTNSLRAQPGMLRVLRMCISPPMARARFVSFTKAGKNLIEKMDRDGEIPPRTPQLQVGLQKICAFLEQHLDRELFCWVADDRSPRRAEREKALLIVGERLAMSFHLSDLRKAQECRQQKLLRAYLESAGFRESVALTRSVPPGTFRFGHNMKGIRRDGETQNLPVDCAVAPLDAALPLACVELKSAGDSTNGNKRRKEESNKTEALKRAHGHDAVFLLLLFGYFEKPYLSFEASDHIDWAWDHRPEDLAPYLGIG